MCTHGIVFAYTHSFFIIACLSACWFICLSFCVALSLSLSLSCLLVIFLSLSLSLSLCVSSWMCVGVDGVSLCQRYLAQRHKCICLWMYNVDHSPKNMDLCFSCSNQSQMTCLGKIEICSRIRHPSQEKICPEHKAWSG